MSKSHSSEKVKKLAIKYYLKNSNVTQDEVAEIFNISKRTFIRWLNKETETLSRKQYRTKLNKNT